MAKMYSKRCVSTAYKHKVGSRYITDYVLGCELWHTKQVLPLDASRNMQQGYVKAAREQDSSLMASAKWQERKGMFQFLPSYSALSYTTGNRLGWGQDTRYPVMKARVIQNQCLRAQGEKEVG